MTDHSVTPIQASSAGNCAAVSIAMATGRSLEEVTALLQAHHAEQVADDGSSNLGIFDLAATAGLPQADPIDTPAEWAQLLANGPVTVSTGVQHVIVVAGIQLSEDEAVAESQVHVVDPFSGDQWLAFSHFVAAYDLQPGRWTAFRRA